MLIAHLIPSFADELEKLAGLAAGLGGVGGYMATPGNIKHKLIGAAVGAGVGGLVGMGAKAMKQRVWDEPRARQAAELYGYTPSAIQYQEASPYYGATNFY